MNFSGAKTVFPRANADWLRQIELQAPAHGIDAVNEMASFLSQFGHETGGFTRFVENLNYGAQGLANTWARFSESGSRGGPPNALALSIERQPERIANIVYADRMWNNLPGDGWRYRGRGPQLTGKHNYCRASVMVNINLIGNPDLLLDPKIGVKVACAGWQALRLDFHDDDADARAERRIINGGEIGLKETQELLTRLLEALA